MLIDTVDACWVNVVQVGTFYHTLKRVGTDHRVETLPNRCPVFELKGDAARVADSLINLNLQAVHPGRETLSVRKLNLQIESTSHDCIL